MLGNYRVVASRVVLSSIELVIPQDKMNLLEVGWGDVDWIGLA
jgi:hypothetical protein